MYRAPLVPENFSPPEKFETEQFSLRPLFSEVMLQDYEAVIKGGSNLAKAFGRASFDVASYTLQREIIEVGWHSGEWSRKKSFAFAIMTLDEKTCYGSVYLYPTFKRDYDAHVVMWVVPDAPGPDFEAFLYATVKDWVASKWPF